MASSRPQRSVRLVDQVRAAIRTRGYATATERSYLHWMKRYVIYHGKRHPAELGAEHIRAFLSYLAVDRNVAASTQNIALNAIVFLYRHVLDQDVGALGKFVRARQPRRLPVVRAPFEAHELLARMRGKTKLVAMLLYGSGLRLGEALNLRVKDLDFEQRQILVRRGKRQKDRVTMLAERIVPPLSHHLVPVKRTHVADLDAGFGEAPLPGALRRN